MRLPVDEVTTVSMHTLPIRSALREVTVNTAVHAMHCCLRMVVFVWTVHVL